MATKKRRIEKQAAPSDADKPPVVLPLKPADIAPPLTFLCRRCGAVGRWEEPHGFDCQGATAEQQRERERRDDVEAGKQ